MTEYWKSQARKYCDFCNCWIADNKVSVSFHENGKRHKENAKKHITKLYKKSAKEHKQKEKMDNEIKKMEEAAMAAYLNDLQNNADLTSKSINIALGENNEPEIVREVPPLPPVWREVKNSDGNSYYWNIETNETVWEAPDNYLSLAQQEEQALKEKELAEKRLRAQEELKKEQAKEEILEAKARVEREKLKKRAVKTEEKPTYRYHYGPEPRAGDPYGSWKPVIKEEVNVADLQLPKVEVFEPPVVVEPEIIKFKEKKVESLGEGPVDFKKRKLNSNFKRNMRQKTNDDE